MWDDKINKKIKDAADQYHPAYDENAWDKMELLLDKHLPVEKKRKRKYFLIPLLSLLLGGLLFIYYNQNNSHSKKSQTIETKNNITATKLLKKNPIVIDKNADSSNITAKPSGTINPISKSYQGEINQKAKNSESKTDEGSPYKSFINPTRETAFNKHAITNATITSAPVREEDATKNNVVANYINDEPGYLSKEHIFSETETSILNNTNLRKEISGIKNIDKIEFILMGKIRDPVVPNKNKSFRNNFAINISAGPDVSSVGFNKAGKMAVNFGAGASYTVSNRFTLRTGFYVAEKIYSADKNQYHVPSGGSNITYLYNIDANCKVYEIPVTVSYNFGRAKNHQWFASAGLSSYLMKKESYDYYYKYPNGSTYTKSWSISNKNQHYFSVLDLSAGYEYSFSKRTSLLAEPYLKMPLSGIGAGKVKLNSGGVLFTFILKPFYKK